MVDEASRDSFDIAPLERAVQRLSEGVARYHADESDTLIRDGLIHRFELTYLSATKLLKRFLEHVAANPVEFDVMSFPDLIRTANEQGLLLGDWSDWRAHREMRGAIGQAYEDETALRVVRWIPHFLTEAEYLCKSLTRRLERES